MVRKLILPALALAAVALYAGCNSSKDAPPQAAVVQTVPSTRGGVPQEHGHQAGGHGGIIVEIGQDNYHAEAVFEKGGVVRLFTLGRDEAKVQEVELQTLNAFAKREGDSEALPFAFEAKPQPDDAPGKTSQFVGQLPAELQGQVVVVSIPNIRIAGERFRIPAFQSARETHDVAVMPPKVADEDERKLYLTPGGVYTEEDIKANGAQTASQRYRGFAAAHDPKPKAGDKICPVTDTKANPKCTWIVAGQAYEFCCPPCIDEFVLTAKERPQEIKAPGDYRK